MAVDVYKDWLGIPEGERPPDYYTLLRLVKFEDDPEKVRSNYKKLNAHVRKYATGEYAAESQQLLNELAKAMLCLTDPERKRELDESMGRESQDGEAEAGRTSLAKYLIRQGKITKDQAIEAKGFAEKRGLSMRDAVVQMKLVDAETAARALAQERGLSYVDLSEMVPDDSVLDKVPRLLVKRHSVLPLFIDDDTLLVACVDELTHELEEELRLRYGVPIRPVVATPLAINQGIAQYYAPGMREDAADVSASGKGGAKRPKRVSQMSPEELQQRRQIAILVSCWGVIGAVLFDVFLLGSIMPSVKTWSIPLLSTWFVAPITGFVLWNNFLKSK